VDRTRVPAFSALATDRLVEEVGAGPGRLLELGSSGIHAAAFVLAGWTVVVAESSRVALERARERAGGVAEVVPVAEVAEGSFDVVVGDGARFLRPGGRLVRPS
jgi:SAM-dependent methyltransferase